MSAPVAPMEARCAVTPLEALYRLIGAASMIDANECKDELIYNVLQSELAVAKEVAKSLAAPVAQPAQQVEAVGQVVAWLRDDGSEAKTAKSKTWMETRDYGVWTEVAKRYVTPLYASPQLEAQQAGDVALKAARYDWLRTQSVGQWEHPIVVEQLRDKMFDHFKYIGPLSGGALDDAIDKAIAQGRKA